MVSLDTFVLIFIGSILWTIMRANDKSHGQTRNQLNFLLETNSKMEQTIKSIDYKLSDKWYPQITE